MNISNNYEDDVKLKMNFEKKVQFGEQLSFKVKEPKLFQSEIPKPIEFTKKNNVPPKKPKKAKGFESQVKAILKGGKVQNKQRPGTAKPLPKGDFNLDTRPQKYFDPSLDPRPLK